MLTNFFHPAALARIERALLRESFARKESDLYSFLQTADLKQSRNPAIAAFYRFFTSADFRQYAASITGTRLGKTVDAAGFVYSDGDYLLPHDDRLESRKIAYVINLARGFTKRDGGELGFFATKGGTPTKVAKTFSPTFNSFVLFKVSRASFHQVNEVLSTRKRLTIAGWFHG